MTASLCQVIVEAARRFGRRCRLQLIDECKPEPWGLWLIEPSAGYIEVDGCGPWAWREVEWVEVDTGEKSAVVAAEALAAAGISVVELAGIVRIPFAGS